MGIKEIFLFLGIQLVKQMCNAVTNGDRQNSCELLFQPKSLKMGNFHLNINPQTAAYVYVQNVLTTIF